LRFLPGAVAFHLHSFSAATLHSTTKQWAGPLVARGATITFGNVAEPFLRYSTRPDLFVATLLRGEQAGEAYASATPAWSWQSVLIGDPLYRPFKVTLEKQLELLDASETGADTVLNGAWRDGVLLRQANLLVAQRKTAKAVNALAAAVRKHPTPALRLALARRAMHPGLAWHTADDVKDADTGLLVEIARYLWKDNKLNDAHHAYKAVLEMNPELPLAIRKRLLQEAAEAAEQAGLTERAAQLRKQI
jgi:tetratricopeptide (TPR) repeat protein